MRYRVVFTFSDGTLYVPTYESDADDLPVGRWAAPFGGTGEFADATVRELLATSLGAVLIHDHGDVTALEVSKLVPFNRLRADIQARREARGED